MKVPFFTFQPDENTVALIGGVNQQIATILQEVKKMSEVADNLRREVQETKDAVAAMNVRVVSVLALVTSLRATLAQNASTGLTPEEVQAMAAELDAAQASLAADGAALDAAVGSDGTTPPPGESPPEAV